MLSRLECSAGARPARGEVTNFECTAALRRGGRQCPGGEFRRVSMEASLMRASAVQIFYTG
jgi:hypothetical protein